MPQLLISCLEFTIIAREFHFIFLESRVRLARVEFMDSEEKVCLKSHYPLLEVSFTRYLEE